MATLTKRKKQTQRRDPKPNWKGTGTLANPKVLDEVEGRRGLEGGPREEEVEDEHLGHVEEGGGKERRGGKRKYFLYESKLHILVEGSLHKSNLPYQWPLTLNITGRE